MNVDDRNLCFDDFSLHGDSKLYCSVINVWLLKKLLLIFSVLLIWNFVGVDSWERYMRDCSSCVLLIEMKFFKR